MNLLFLLFTFAFANVLVKEGGDTYINWKSVSSCPENNTCIEPINGVYYLTQENGQFMSGNDKHNTILLQGGETAEVTLYSTEATPNYYFKKIGESSNSVTYKLVIPFNTQPMSVYFEACDGSLNDVNVKFLKKTSADTGLPPLLYFKGGSNWIGGVRNDFTQVINYKFEYEGSGEQIDFTNYAHPVFQESKSFSFFWPQIAEYDFSNPVVVNIGEQGVTPDGAVTFKNNYKNDVFEFKYEFIDNTDTDPSRNWFKLCQISLVNTIHCGYKQYEPNKFGYTCDYQPGDAVVVENNGVFKFDKTQLVGNSDWPTYDVFAEGGHHFEFTLNNIVGFDVQVTKGSVLGLDEKISVKYIIPSTGSNCGIAFWGCEGMLNDVELYFMKASEASSRQIYIKSGYNYTTPVSYKIVYELDSNANDFTFDNYATGIFQTNTALKIKYANIPIANYYNAIKTNLGKQNPSKDNVEIGVIPLPEEYEKLASDGKRYYYTFTEIKNSDLHGDWFNRYHITSDISGNNIWGYKRDSNYKYTFKKTIQSGDEGIVLYDHEAQAYVFKGSDFTGSDSWAPNQIIAQGGHTIQIHADLTKTANIELMRDPESTGKVKYKVKIPTKGAAFGILFKECDGMLEDVDIILLKQKQDEQNSGIVYIKGGQQDFNIPIKYNVQYELDEIDHKVDFTKYKIIQWQESKLYEIKTTNIPKNSYDNVKTNLQVKTVDMNLPGVVTIKTDYYEEYFVVFKGQKVNDWTVDIYMSIVGGSSGFMSTIEEGQIIWNYVEYLCTPNMDCVFENEDGSFDFDKKQMRENKTFVVIPMGGQKVNIKLDANYLVNVSLSSVKESKGKVSYHLDIPAIAQAKVELVDCDGKLNPVTVSFTEKGSEETLGTVEIVGGQNFQNITTYEITYNYAVSSTFNFKNYATLKMTTTNKYDLKISKLPITAEANQPVTMETNIVLAVDQAPLPTMKLYSVGKYYYESSFTSSDGKISVTISRSTIVTEEGYLLYEDYPKGDIFDTDPKYFKYFEAIIPSENEGKYIKIESGIFKFTGNIFSQYSECTNHWLDVVIEVQPGHKIQIDTEAQGCIDWWLAKPEGANQQAGDIKFILHPKKPKSSLSLYPNADGYYNNIEIEMMKTYDESEFENPTSECYIKTAVNNQFTNKVNYKMMYENLIVDDYNTIDFLEYPMVVFEGSDDYTMELIDFPTSFRSYLGKSMNIYPKSQYPVPVGGKIQDGNTEVTVSFSFGSTIAFTHVDILKIKAWPEGEEVTGNSGMYREDTWSYDYSYKEIIPESDSYFSYFVELNQPYTFNSDNASPYQEKTTIHPGPKTKVISKFDRKEGKDDGEVSRLEYHLIADKGFDLSETELSVVFGVNKLDGILKVKQVENKFTKPIQLEFEQASDENDLGTENNKIYLKGNYDDNTVDDEDKIEHVIYQLKYKYDGKDDFDFSKYKEVYFQEYHAIKGDGKGGYTIKNIFFNGYYPEFPDPIKTNLYANNAATVYNEQQQEVVCPQNIKQIKTQPYPVYRKKSIIYTLSFDDGMEETLAQYSIQSEWIEADNPDAPEEPTEGNNDNGSSSIFAMIIVFLMFFF